MIQMEHIEKKYGNKKAVDDVSLSIGEGEIVGLLGPNGAGKTTIMSILTGYISCNKGKVTVDGFDILQQPLEVKKRIGYLPENPPLYHDMTVLDYLSFVYDLKKATLPKQEHLEKVMNTVRILDVKDRLIKNLSKGYKQRVGMAQALVGDPPILIFDEPTVGLDPKQMTEIRAMIKQLGRKRTVILSSHILPEVSAVCQRVIIINKGRIVASDTIENITRDVSSNVLTACIEGEKQTVLDTVRSLPGVASVSAQPCGEEGCMEYAIHVSAGNDIRRDLFLVLAEKRLPLLALNSQTLSLEDVFLQLTAGRQKKEGAR